MGKNTKTYRSIILGFSSTTLAVNILFLFVIFHRITNENYTLRLVFGCIFSVVNIITSSIYLAYHDILKKKKTDNINDNNKNRSYFAIGSLVVVTIAIALGVDDAFQINQLIENGLRKINEFAPDAVRVVMFLLSMSAFIVSVYNFQYARYSMTD
jgi:hypothetical protein